uniref:T9SS type A sorting domain-containing protein n=1 Tax=Dyadobacter alkalitolerans TaxID=492736 RepID=UPI00146F971C
ATSVRLLTPGTLERVTSLTIDDQGQYTVDSLTGVVTFTPEAGFSDTTFVDYVITDENGLESIATISVIVDCPLPVKLVAFDARKESNTARLTWSTTEEVNSDRFEIERSASGKDWNKIGMVSSHGESTVLREYSFVDASPISGQNLYRLRMVDKDETFAYSSVRNVTFAELARLSPYPNPVSERFHITNHQQIKQVAMHNQRGMKVFGSQGVTSEGIDVSRLSPGLYTVTLTLFDGTISTHKVAVTR